MANVVISKWYRYDDGECRCDLHLLWFPSFINCVKVYREIRLNDEPVSKNQIINILILVNKL